MPCPVSPRTPRQSASPSSTADPDTAAATTSSAGFLENRGHAQQQGPPEKNLQHPKARGKIGGYCASVRPGTAPDGAGRPGADSRPAFVHEKLCQAYGRPHQFDGLCDGGTIGHGQTNGALSRRPGSAQQCGPSCASRPGGSEHPETAGLDLHENKRRRQIL